METLSITTATSVKTDDYEKAVVAKTVTTTTTSDGVSATAAVKAVEDLEEDKAVVNETAAIPTSNEDAELLKQRAELQKLLGLDEEAEVKADEGAKTAAELLAEAADQNKDTQMEGGHVEASPAPAAAATLPDDADVLAVAAGLGVLPAHAPTMDFIPPAAGADTTMAEPNENDEPEAEEDSDPYQSSSSDSSDDSSSEEDSDDDDAYQLLDPAEQARILMEEGGGSDDESGKKGSGGQLRTKNEVPEEVIPKPDVTITPEMKIEHLGDVQAIVENMVLIEAKTSGEYQVLESNSVLCLEDRSVIGVVAETLGRVEQPLYVVRFTNNEEIQKAGLSKGTKVYYSEKHSTYVFTQALKAYKGSDASNLHDEEVGDEEIEFSDDEAEMEHKRKIKQKKLERRGIKPGEGRGRGGRSGHPLRQEMQYNTAQGISYDDEEDGPYKPLARPSGYASTVGKTEAPEEAAGGYSTRRPSHSASERPQPISSRGRGGAEGRGRGRGGFERGGGRGRGSDRGRGGDRGGRGGMQQQRYPPAPADAPQDPRKAPGYVAPPPAAYPAYPNPYGVPNPQAAFQMPQGYAAPPYMGMPFPSSPQGWAPPATGQPQAGAPPAGSHVNPAYFAQQMAAMQQMAQQQQQWAQYAAAQQQAQGQQPGQPPVPAYGWPAQAPAPAPVQQQQAPAQGQAQSPDAARAVSEAQEKLRILRENMGGPK